MTLLAKPDYIVRDKVGRLVELFCKCCGATIAKTYTEGRHKKFRYLTNYTELKFSLEDKKSRIKSFHVTNCCKNCVPRVLADEKLRMAFHAADIDVLAERNPELLEQKKRLKPKVVGMQSGVKGIV